MKIHIRRIVVDRAVARADGFRTEQLADRVQAALAERAGFAPDQRDATPPASRTPSIAERIADAIQLYVDPHLHRG